MKERQKRISSLKKVLCLIFATLIFFAVSIFAVAVNEAVSNSTLEIEISTDKADYKVTDIAKITATVTNTSDKDIKNVSAEAVFTDLAPVGRGSTTSKQAETLKAGESISFTYEATLNMNEHKLNIFQKIIIFFVRLFRGAYSVKDNGFDDGRDCVQATGSIIFGKFSADNQIKVWYNEVKDDEPEFAGGDGTEANPYQVATPKQLNSIRYHLDSFFIQTSDIDMSNWGNWEPIGKAVPHYSTASGAPNLEEQLFSGTFDGDSYKISNLTIKNDKVSAQYDCYGLFAGAKDAIIKNVNLENVNFDINKLTTDYMQIWETEKRIYSICVGGVLGINKGCIVINCTVKGYIKAQHCNDAYVGGIVGYGNADKCKNYADIFVYADQNARSESDSKVYCGGITGRTNAVKDSISCCSNCGNISATAGNFLYAGGITGSYGTIIECMNMGDISGKRLFGSSTTTGSSDCNVGGISGYAGGLVVKDCINYGEIYAYSYKYITNCGISAGGICGSNTNYGEVINCYNKGQSVKAEYAEDQKNTNAWVGRIVGFGYMSENCFSVNCTTVSGNTKGQHIDGTDLTSNDFLKEETYIGFDFENTWKIDPEVGGAVLR